MDDDGAARAEVTGAEILTPEREALLRIKAGGKREKDLRTLLAEIDRLRFRLATVEAERDEEAQQQRYQRQRAVEAEHRELAALTPFPADDIGPPAQEEGA